MQQQANFGSKAKGVKRKILHYTSPFSQPGQQSQKVYNSMEYDG